MNVVEVISSYAFLSMTKVETQLNANLGLNTMGLPNTAKVLEQFILRYLQ